MTGYGRGEASADGISVTVEIKSINQRFLDIIIRIPRYYTALEEKIRQILKKSISRGRIEVFLSISEENVEKRPVTVDMGLAMAYYNALKELAQNLGIPEGVTAEQIFLMPEVIKVKEPEWDEATLWPVISRALEQALEELLVMRQAEGQKLQTDLKNRVEFIRSKVEAIRKKAPEIPGEYAVRLKERLAELAEGVPLDEGRLEMEVAIMADRSDITEEIVRLSSHLEQIEETLKGSEPAGRRLDFILQEMWREINTISSKSGNLSISHMAVAVKSELEKMREQVQNVE